MIACQKYIIRIRLLSSVLIRHIRNETKGRDLQHRAVIAGLRMVIGSTLDNAASKHGLGCSCSTPETRIAPLQPSAQQTSAKPISRHLSSMPADFILPNRKAGGFPPASLLHRSDNDQKV